MSFMINENWHTNVRIISQVNTSNFDFITIKCRPLYLPRDFSSFRLTAVYIHPRADTNAAVKDLHSTISTCGNDDPNTLSIAAGDFNKQSWKAQCLNIINMYHVRPETTGFKIITTAKRTRLIDQYHVHVIVIQIMQLSR